MKTTTTNNKIKEIKKIEKDGIIRSIYEINGYKVSHYKTVFGICIQISLLDQNSYLPEIHFDNYDFDKMETINRFTIQTTSYGALEMNEINKVIESYKTAQETVEELKKFFDI